MRSWLVVVVVVLGTSGCSWLVHDDDPLSALRPLQAEAVAVVVGAGLGAEPVEAVRLPCSSDGPDRVLTRWDTGEAPPADLEERVGAAATARGWRAVPQSDPVRWTKDIDGHLHQLTASAHPPSDDPVGPTAEADVLVEVARLDQEPC